MGKGQPILPDPTISIRAGIDPKYGTKVPPKRGANNLFENFRKLLRVMDEQTAVNRYKWFNLPCDISSQELERLIYYKGQLVFFYLEELDRFYFMPFALDGTIDFYGRYNRVHPVPMTSGKEEDGKVEDKGTQAEVLSKKKLDIVYAPIPFDELEPEDLKKGVIIHDYTRQMSQEIISRQELNEPLLQMMAEIPPLLRTSLIAGTGVKGMRVPDADAKSEVAIAAKDILNAALSGEMFTPITSPIEFQELTDKTLSKAQDYLLSLQALDNFRLSTYGLENGGIFEKKAHVNESEQALNISTVAPIEDDGLAIRQNFCNIANSIWGTSMWCEPAESVLGVDNNGDGRAYDENKNGQNSGTDTTIDDGGSTDEDI